jgi:hypothetical protein
VRRDSIPRLSALLSAGYPRGQKPASACCGTLSHAVIHCDPPSQRYRFGSRHMPAYRWHTPGATPALPPGTKGGTSHTSPNLSSSETDRIILYCFAYLCDLSHLTSTCYCLSTITLLSLPCCNAVLVAVIRQSIYIVIASRPHP